MKRTLSLLLTAALALSLLSGCGPKNPSAGGSSSAPGSSSSQPGGSGQDSSADRSTPEVDVPAIKFMALSGPTGVGASWLMDNYSAENAFEGMPFILDSAIVTDNEEVKNALINGDVDIAAIATNLAANLYAKSDGAIQVLVINTMGVLYILEKGDTVHSMADLKGKTLYCPSNTKGANPEHILNHLLKGNGVAPSDVNIEWLTPQEITAKMSSSDSGICMLPVPAATALLVKDSGVREAVNIGEAWQDLEGMLPMGCLVARTKYIQENPQAVEQFLSAYHESIAYMADPDNRADAAALVVEYGFAPNAKVAEKAIPQCSLACMPGVQMKDVLENYYEVLFQTAPESIGGGLPYDSFYYGVS